MKRMGMMEIASLVMQGADQGVAAFAPILAQTMPAAVRVAYIQRVSSLLAERAAFLSRVCGDAQASALTDKRDVAQAHLQELQSIVNDLKRMAALLPAAAMPIGTEELALAYKPQAPQAQRVMETKDGGL